MSFYVGPVTDSIINTIIDEIRKKENKEKIINGVFDPILTDISTKYYPYIIFFFSTLITIIILLILIIFLILIKYNK